MRRVMLLVAVMLVAILGAASAVAYAKQSEMPTPGTSDPITIENHSWGGYHWARTANPFTLKVGDNVSTAWDSYLDTAISDWSKSSVLDLTKVAGGTSPRKCRPTAGRDEVCNGTYGNNGWLGIASISVSGGTHITQGTVKLNDTYFNQTKYNTPAWRNLVSCQEVGHTLGLDHQDENFSNPNLGTCMDYTNAPDGGGSYGADNEHPNQHDYDELQTIYSHLDSTTTIGASIAGSANDPRNDPGDNPRAWGREVFRSADGRVSVYELDLPKGGKKITHVRWTEEQAAKHKKA